MRPCLLALALAACTPDPDPVDATDGDTDTADTDTDTEVPQDLDGDGYGADDCEDGDAAVHPGAGERCGGVDEDCDGLLDDRDPDLVDAPTWYVDGDGDGYGADNAAVEACAPSSSQAVARGGDCDDADPTRAPDQPEVCGGFDEDCDGRVDDDDDDVDPAGLSTWFEDLDGDRYGGAAVTGCAPPEGAPAEGGDCDDRDPEVRGPIDWAEDVDQDGFGGGAVTASCVEVPGAVELFRGFDCADGEPDVNPLAEDVCGDGADSDCDGWDACHPRVLGEVSADLIPTRVFGASPGVYTGFRVDLSPDLTGDGRDDLVFDDSGISEGLGLRGTVRVVAGPVVGDLRLQDGGTVAAIHSGERSSALIPFGTGDLDGDGFGDLAVGAPDDGPGGDVGVVAWFRGPLMGDYLVDDGAGRVAGRRRSVDFGSALAGGDLTGDGVPDLLVGDPSDGEYSADPHGMAWLVPGPPGVAEVSAVAAFSIEGTVDDQLGHSVVVADVNGDGAMDAFVGAPHGTVGGVFGGHGYLFRGPVSGAITTADADRSYSAPGTYAGWVATAVDDWDGDGVGDLAIGTGQFDHTAWVVSGRGAGEVDLDASLAVIDGRSDSFGSTIANPGDLDGDGLGDLLVGGPSAPDFGSTQGQVFVLLGGQLGAVSADVDAIAVVTGTRVDDLAGYPSRGGDLDGDGARDWLVGAPGVNDDGHDRGAVFVVYGASPL